MSTALAKRAVSLTILGLLLANGQDAAAAEIVAAKADPTKQLLLDARVVARTQGLRLVMGRVEKEARNPLFLADRPWENALNNLYPNLLWDEDERVFKLWYKCVLADPEAIAKMMPPNTVHDVGWFLLYATSADGLTWQKPELGLFGFDGSTRNNIVARDTPNVGVFKDPHDADPARRYKMIYDVGVGKMRVRFSKDGLRWSEPAEPQGFTDFTGDTHNNAFWDSRQQSYVCLTRFYLGERLVARSHSRDFLNWENTRLALRSTPAEGRQRQLYCMPAFPYANGYIGLLMVYNAGTDRTVDCELAYSPDTVTWQRILPGTTFIPRGPKGSYDGACIYAQSGSPVLRDGRMMIFYGGSEQVHRGWKRHCLPCLAYLRPDGFAGYEPAEAGGAGTLVTSPMKLIGQPLQITADAVDGRVSATIMDARGRELAVCQPVSGNLADAPLELCGGHRWEDLAGQVVQLQFVLQQARLYAFRGVEFAAATETSSVSPVPEPAPARRPEKPVTVRSLNDQP